jgi:VWFA-related protein
MVRRIAILVLAATIPGAAAGDQRHSDEGEASRFHASSEMVLVNASVVDSRGRPISGLTRENFRLFESHAEKKIAWFSEDQAPLSMLIVFDTSGSMEGKLSRCAEAVADLIRSSQTGDEFALVTFSDQPRLMQTWTRDETAIPSALMSARTRGTTALIDALRFAGRYANTGSKTRKLLFVLSDGGDNSSRYTEAQVLRQLQEMDLELYAVNIHEPGATPPYPGLVEGPALLGRLCEGLAGRYIGIERMGELGEAVERIRREIRSQYVLGYRPGALERDGRYHPVEVKVAPPAGMHRISVRWRRGWREPQGEGAVVE